MWGPWWSKSVPRDEPPKNPRLAVVLFNLGGPDRPEAIKPFR